MLVNVDVVETSVKLESVVDSKSKQSRTLLWSLCAFQVGTCIVAVFAMIWAIIIAGLVYTTLPHAPWNCKDFLKLTFLLLNLGMIFLSSILLRVAVQDPKNDDNDKQQIWISNLAIIIIWLCYGIFYSLAHFGMFFCLEDHQFGFLSTSFFTGCLSCLFVVGVYAALLGYVNKQIKQEKRNNKS